MSAESIHFFFKKLHVQEGNLLNLSLSDYVWDLTRSVMG